MFVHKEVIRKQNNIDNNLLPQFAALSERQRRRFYPPKMVQLCLRILYARTANYKILKPLSLVNIDIFMFSKKCTNNSKL